MVSSDADSDTETLKSKASKQQTPESFWGKAHLSFWNVTYGWNQDSITQGMQQLHNVAYCSLIYSLIFLQCSHESVEIFCKKKKCFKESAVFLCMCLALFFKFLLQLCVIGCSHQICSFKHLCHDCQCVNHYTKITNIHMYHTCHTVWSLHRAWEVMSQCSFQF